MVKKLLEYLLNMSLIKLKQLKMQDLQRRLKVAQI